MQWNLWPHDPTQHSPESRKGFQESLTNIVNLVIDACENPCKERKEVFPDEPYPKGFPTNYNCPALMLSLYLQESELHPYVVSSTGAAGIAQFMPDTAIEYGPMSIMSRKPHKTIWKTKKERMEGTPEELEKIDDRFVLETAIPASVCLMNDLMHIYDDHDNRVWYAFNAYSCGQGCVDKYIRKKHGGKKAKLPKETRGHEKGIRFAYKMITQYRN